MLGLIGLLLTVMLVFGSFVHLWTRLRASQGEDRVRLLWPVWGSLSVPSVLVFGWVNYFLLGDHELPFAIALALLSVPVADDDRHLRSATTGSLTSSSCSAVP